MEDLKWEVERKEREIETLKQQLDMTEQRSHKELEGIQVVLQVFNQANSDGLEFWLIIKRIILFYFNFFFLNFYFDCAVTFVFLQSLYH